VKVVVQRERQKRHVTHPQARAQAVEKLEVPDIFNGGVIDNVVPVVELEFTAQ